MQLRNESIAFHVKINSTKYSFRKTKSQLNAWLDCCYRRCFWWLLWIASYSSSERKWMDLVLLLHLQSFPPFPSFQCVLFSAAGDGEMITHSCGPFVILRGSVLNCIKWNLLLSEDLCGLIPHKFLFPFGLFGGGGGISLHSLCPLIFKFMLFFNYMMVLKGACNGFPGVLPCRHWLSRPA